MKTRPPSAVAMPAPRARGRSRRCYLRCAHPAQTAGSYLRFREDLTHAQIGEIGGPRLAQDPQRARKTSGSGQRGNPCSGSAGDPFSRWRMGRAAASWPRATPRPSSLLIGALDPQLVGLGEVMREVAHVERVRCGGQLMHDRLRLGRGNDGGQRRGIERIARHRPPAQVPNQLLLGLAACQARHFVSASSRRGSSCRPSAPVAPGSRILIVSALRSPSSKDDWPCAP